MDQEARKKAAAHELAEAWRNNLSQIARLIVDSVSTENRHKTGTYRIPDLEQMVMGAHAIMIEELSGDSRDIRDTFFPSVFVTMISNGETLSGIVAQIVLNAVVTHSYLIPKISEENREGAALYLRQFWGTFNAEIVEAYLREQKNLAS